MKKTLQEWKFYFKEMFNNSFRNPFDAPGLIIIGLIINIYIYILIIKK